MGKLKKTLGIAGAAAGAAVGVAYLSKSENREKVKKIVGLGNESDPYFKKIGRPGAVGATDDAKMVDEGALTSVQYYNELQDNTTDTEKEKD